MDTSDKDERAQLSETQVIQRLISGAIAHLTQYLDDGCYRSAYLATMLLERLADVSSDRVLSQQARLLVEMLERKANEALCMPRYPRLPSPLKAEHAPSALPRNGQRHCRLSTTDTRY